MPTVINAVAAERIRNFLKDAFQRDERPRGSQADLARVAGVTASAVNHWKQGVTVPDQQLWTTIAAYLGYAPDAIEIAAGGGNPLPVAKPDLAAARTPNPALEQRFEAIQAEIASMQATFAQLLDARTAATALARELLDDENMSDVDRQLELAKLRLAAQQERVELLTRIAEATSRTISITEDVRAARQSGEDLALAAAAEVPVAETVKASKSRKHLRPTLTDVEHGDQ
jgi:transcriptional regulator with XRE-family HTH domain